MTEEKMRYYGAYIGDKPIIKNGICTLDFDYFIRKISTVKIDTHLEDKI